MTAEILCSREDGGGAIKNGVAMDRTQLGGAEDGGEDEEKASNQDLCQ